VIPQTLLGLAAIAASLGPGYLYVRRAGRHRPRPDQSQLGDAVEMLVIGAMLSLASAGIVLALGEAIGALNTVKLSADFDGYVLTEPIRAFSALLLFYGLAYGGALLAARVVHRSEDEEVDTAGSLWHRAMRLDLPDDRVSMVTVELKDGRKVVGRLRGFTIESGHNRELALKRPIGASAGPTSLPAELDDDFMVIREEQIACVSGRYVAASPE